jgi:hypothetical protein
MGINEKKKKKRLGILKSNVLAPIILILILVVLVIPIVYHAKI